MSQRESFEENYHNCRAREKEEWSAFRPVCGARARSGKVLGARLLFCNLLVRLFCVLRFCPIFRARIIMYAPLWEFQSKSRSFTSRFSMALSPNEKIVACESPQMACGVFKRTKHTCARAGWLAGRAMCAFELNKIEQFIPRARLLYCESNYGQ
jgi:hypothetical protein